MNKIMPILIIMFLLQGIVGCQTRTNKYFAIIIEKTDDGYGFRCDDKDLLNLITIEQDSDKSRHIYVKKFQQALPYMNNFEMPILYGLKIHPRDDGNCYLTLNGDKIKIDDSMVGKMFNFPY